MVKTWKLNESKTNKLILIAENCIYKGNPKDTNWERLDINTNHNSISKDLFGIPYAYVKRVENQKNKNQITIFYGEDSEEEIMLNNERVKDEIFNYLKCNIPNIQYVSKLPNVFSYAKPQLFALLSTTGIFVWALYLAIQMANGVEYELVGSRPGITGIVLVIANLGVFKIIVGYIVLMAIALYSLVRRLRTRSEIEILFR